MVAKIRVTATVNLGWGLAAGEKYETKIFEKAISDVELGRGMMLLVINASHIEGIRILPVDVMDG